LQTAAAECRVWHQKAGNLALTVMVVQGAVSIDDLPALLRRLAPWNQSKPTPTTNGSAEKKQDNR
jgi:hypothetical protein